MSSYGRKKYLPLIILLCALCIAGCRSDNQKDTRKTAANSVASEKGISPDDIPIEANLKKAEIGWVDGQGRPLWKVSFNKGGLAQSGKDAVVRLVDVKAQLYHNGELAAVMDAPLLTADSRTRLMSASGGVKVVSSEGNGYMTAEKMIWKSKENKVYGYGDVRLRKGTISASASKAAADTALNRVSLTNAEIVMK